MKNKKNTLKKVIGIIVAIIIVLGILGISWILFCGIAKIITLLLGWKFSWRVVTAIWLILGILFNYFGRNRN